MATATLVKEGLTQFCPKTNHYQCSDGTWLLVTVKDLGALFGLPGFANVPVSPAQAPAGVDVFLSDENATVLDADGNPANGMTPLAVFESGDFESALASLGYTIE